MPGDPEFTRVRQVNSATPGVTGDLFHGEKECVSVVFRQGGCNAAAAEEEEEDNFSELHSKKRPHGAAGVVRNRPRANSPSLTPESPHLRVFGAAASQPGGRGRREISGLPPPQSPLPSSCGSISF